MKIKNQKTHLTNLFTVPKHDLTALVKDYIANRVKTEEIVSTRRNFEVWYTLFRSFIYQYDKREVVMDNKGIGRDYVNFLMKRGLANSTIKKNVVMLMTVINSRELVHGLSTRNLFTDFAKQDPSNDSWFMTEKEVKQLLSLNWPHKRERLILDRFIIACFTGCRRSEIDTIEIIDDKTLQYHTTKNRKNVKVPFVNQLRAYLVDDEFKYGVILNTNDRRMESDTLTKIFKSLGWTKMVKKYKLSGKKKTMYKIPRHDAIRFHDARKWYGKMLLDMDVPMYKVSQLLGHSTIELTQRTYASLNREKMIDEVNDLINKF